MSEIHLETFKLQTSVLTWVPGSPKWTTHWGIRVNEQVYELEVRKRDLWPCPFTFGPTQKRRELITSTYIGVTHYNEEQLQVIGMFTISYYAIFFIC